MQVCVDPPPLYVPHLSLLSPHCGSLTCTHLLSIHFSTPAPSITHPIDPPLTPPQWYDLPPLWLLSDPPPQIPPLPLPRLRHMPPTWLPDMPSLGIHYLPPTRIPTLNLPGISSVSPPDLPGLPLPEIRYAPPPRLPLLHPTQLPPNLPSFKLHLTITCHLLRSCASDFCPGVSLSMGLSIIIHTDNHTTLPPV